MSQDAFRNFVVLSFFKKFFGRRTAGWAHLNCKLAERTALSEISEKISHKTSKEII